MPRTTLRLSFLACTALLLTGCGQGSEEIAEPAGEPLTAAPTSAPGVPQDELETRQAISGLGTAARALENAEDLDSARDALGRFEADFAEGADDIPAELQTQFREELESARAAVAADDLAAARAAGQAMINVVIRSERIQDPSLFRPNEADQ